jgi:hypothetical protein
MALLGIEGLAIIHTAGSFDQSVAESWKRFFRRAWLRFRRGRSIAIRRLFYFSDSVPIRFGDFRAFASERAMSGGEAACARFPVEHSWFLNRARRRLWAS